MGGTSVSLHAVPEQEVPTATSGVQRNKWLAEERMKCGASAKTLIVSDVVEERDCQDGLL